MAHLVHTTVQFISAHSGWAFAIIFGVTFGESFAFVSLLFPGTAIVLTAGTLVHSGVLSAWPVALGAIAGAVTGDFISYWLGLRFGHALERWWPFNRHPDLLNRGREFFRRYGGLSVFIGRFFGPVRAAVPLVAGMVDMPAIHFSIANVASAIIWAPMLLFAGWLTATVVSTLHVHENWVGPILLGLVVIATLAAWLGRRYFASVREIGSRIRR
jgi:membrane protein DedA with SNARE-associated domain